MTSTTMQDQFAAHFSTSPQVITRAPGRVNLIGDHTDYCDGFAMPMAIDLETTALAAAGSEPHCIRVYSEAFDHTLSIDVGTRPTPQGDWGDYVRGVVAGWLAAGLPTSAVDILIGGDLPQGAGLSSSAALELATLLALETLSGLSLSNRQRINLCRTAENEFAGMPCGILDQFAVTMAEHGKAMLLDCRAVDATPVALPETPRFALVDSGVRHQLTDGGYAQRLNEARAAEQQLQQSLRDASLTDIEQLTDATLRARARHIVTENHRVLAFAEAVSNTNWVRAGQLLNQSHRSLRDDYAVSCQAVDELVNAATAAGALGARMTGGGFGGSVIMLVDARSEQSFTEALMSWQATHASAGHPIRWLTPADGAQARQLQGG